MQLSVPIAEIQHLHPNEGSLWCAGSEKLEIDELRISSPVWQITEQAHRPDVKQMLPTERSHLQHVGMNRL